MPQSCIATAVAALVSAIVLTSTELTIDFTLERDVGANNQFMLRLPAAFDEISFEALANTSVRVDFDAAVEGWILLFDRRTLVLKTQSVMDGGLSYTIGIDDLPLPSLSGDHDLVLFGLEDGETVYRDDFVFPLPTLYCADSACLTCADGVCLQCSPAADRPLLATDGTCVTACPPGEFRHAAGAFCQECGQANCFDCPANFCEACDAGYILSASECSDECVTECPAGQHGVVDEDEVCTPCSTAYCETCEPMGDGTVCTACLAPRFLIGDRCMDECPEFDYFMPSEMECIACAPNILCPGGLTCTGPNRTGEDCKAACILGAYDDGGVCTACDANFLCSTELTCTGANHTGENCTSGCEPGAYDDGGVCTACDTNYLCSSGLVCTGANHTGENCTSGCEPGAYDEGGVCTACEVNYLCSSGLVCTGANHTGENCTSSCDPGAYDDGGVCTACDTNDMCSSGLSCTGANHTGEICAGGCELGAYDVDGVCTVVPTTCSNDLCVSNLTCPEPGTEACGGGCVPGAYVNNTNGVCAECVPGTYFNTTAMACTGCSTDNCDLCQDDQCSQCSADTILTSRGECQLACPAGEYGNVSVDAACGACQSSEDPSVCHPACAGQFCNDGLRSTVADTCSDEGVCTGVGPPEPLCDLGSSSSSYITVTTNVDMQTQCRGTAVPIPRASSCASAIAVGARAIAQISALGCDTCRSGFLTTLTGIPTCALSGLEYQLHFSTICCPVPAVPSTPEEAEELEDSPTVSKTVVVAAAASSGAAVALCCIVMIVVVVVTGAGTVTAAAVVVARPERVRITFDDLETARLDTTYLVTSKVAHQSASIELASISVDGGSARYSDRFSSIGFLSSLQSCDQKLDVPQALEAKTTKKIGAGGSGSVYAAAAAGGGDHMFAIKVLEDHTADGISEFYQEAVVLKLLQGHMWSVQMLALCPVTPAIVMPLYQRGSLADALDDKKGFAMTAEECMKELANAVAALHQIGYAHLDLKPGNVLVSSNGSLILADYGLAVAAAEQTTMSGFAGTIPYAAPERFCKNPFDPKAADMFSLGCIAWEVDTKTVPFRKINVLKTVVPVYSEADEKKCTVLLAKHFKWPDTLVGAYSKKCMDVVASLRPTAAASAGLLG